MGDTATPGNSGSGAVAGAAGYAAAAGVLVDQYEGVTFEEVHRDTLDLVPLVPSQVLDVGAGTGRDAAALARRGHFVVAVEPTAELREYGQRVHDGLGIAWLDDALPDLRLLGEGARFDAVFATAVWMHLDVGERARAMTVIAALLGPGGLFFLNLRHGPVPVGRRMFDVSVAETEGLAAAAGLKTLRRRERPDLHGRHDVRWSELVFMRPQRDCEHAAPGAD